MPEKGGRGYLPEEKAILSAILSPIQSQRQHKVSEEMSQMEIFWPLGKFHIVWTEFNNV